MIDRKTIELLNEIYSVYPVSINECGDSTILMAKGVTDYVIVFGSLMEHFDGIVEKHKSLKYKKCPLTNKNACILRECLPFSRPKRVLKEKNDKLDALENEKTLTFLKRAPKIVLNSLSFKSIVNSYKKLLAIIKK